ncbi:hypothetical protein B484DRAFT_442171 [Ochromonadaceae sp. CCMP2298]|nr:hypothetical protein B484DRAFT_442171 [Ochromonadaceae sp. CCMP2298]
MENLLVYKVLSVQDLATLLFLLPFVIFCGFCYLLRNCCAVEKLSAQFCCSVSCSLGCPHLTVRKLCDKGSRLIRLVEFKLANEGRILLEQLLRADLPRELDARFRLNIPAVSRDLHLRCVLDKVHCNMARNPRHSIPEHTSKGEVLKSKYGL